MVLKDKKPELKQVKVLKRETLLVDTMLSEVNEVVANVEKECLDSILNSHKENRADIDEDFIKKILDIRIDRYSKEPDYAEHPKSLWQDELKVRVDAKLQEIRDLRTREKRYKDE